MGNKFTDEEAAAGIVAYHANKPKARPTGKVNLRNGRPAPDTVKAMTFEQVREFLKGSTNVQS